MPAALPFVAAGGQAASGAKGARGAQQASADAIALQQQALNLANPPELRAGRQNVATGINNLAGGFFGDGSATDLGGQFTDIAPQQGVSANPPSRSIEEGSQNITGDDFTPRRSDKSVNFGVKSILDPAGVVFGEPLLADDIVPGVNINDPLGLGFGGEGGGFLDDGSSGTANISPLPGIPQELITDFSGQGQGALGRLADLSNVPTDSRIGGLINEQVDSLTGVGQQQGQNLQNFQQQVGNIGEQTQSGLQGLLQQAGGANQDIQSLLNNNNPDAQNEQGLGRFLDVAGNVAENAGAQSQFTDPLQETLAQTRNLNSQVLQDSQALISANEEQSRFEEDRAITELNDQLASRGLGSSSAAIDALTSAKQRFSRGRSQDAAKIGAQARQQQFQNQLNALSQSGNLASIGGQLQQQGLNTQLRGAGVGGQLLGQGTQNTLGLLQQQRGQNQDIGRLLQQLGGNRLSTAESQFGLQQQINDQGFNTRAQQLGLLQGGEGRAQQNQQQRFSNFQGGVVNPIQQLLSQLFSGGQAAGGQAAQISNQVGGQQFANSIAQQRGAGQAVGGATNLLSEGFAGTNSPAPAQQQPALGPPPIDTNVIGTPQGPVFGPGF